MHAAEYRSKSILRTERTEDVRGNSAVRGFKPVTYARLWRGAHLLVRGKRTKLQLESMKFPGFFATLPEAK